jgi:DNA/RNA endonuclease YhcR with UshA esterase domain
MCYGSDNRKCASSSLGRGACIIAIVILLGIQVYGETRISEIGRDKIGQSVTIAGKIDAISYSSGLTNPYSFAINDGSGTIRLIVWPQIYKGIENAASLKEGTMVKASGTVREYQGELQLHLASPGSITALASPPGPVAKPQGRDQQTGSEGTQSSLPTETAAAVTQEIPVVPCRAVTREMLGKRVCVRGNVVSFMPSWKATAPNTITIKDDTGATDAVYWQNTRAKLPEKLQNPQPGLRLEIKGEVNEYRGNMQLRVTSSTDIMELAAEVSQSNIAQEPAKGAQPPSVSMSTATPLFAPVAAVAGTAAPEKPQGQPPAQVGSQPSPPAMLNPFAVTTQSGPAPVKTATVTPTPTLAVSPVAISSITRQMSGAKVTVAGKIKNIAKVGEDDLLLVEDGTGRVYVPIWDWAKKQLPESKRPQIDGTICVQGFVHFPSGYEDTLIVITALDDIISYTK